MKVNFLAKIFVLIFISTIQIVNAQNSDYKLQGCENSKNKTAKEYCEAKNFNSTYSLKFEKVLKKYREKVPEGITNLEFTIDENGEMTDLKYLDFDNLQFAKLALAILIEIQGDFKKFGLKFNPIIDTESGHPIKFVHRIPVIIKFD